MVRLRETAGVLLFFLGSQGGVNPKFPVHKRVNPVHTVHTPVHTVHTPVHMVRNSVHNPELVYFSEISTPNSLRLVLAVVVLVGDVDDHARR